MSAVSHHGHGGLDGRLMAEGGVSVDDEDLEDGPRVSLHVRAAILGGGVAPRGQQALSGDAPWDHAWRGVCVTGVWWAECGDAAGFQECPGQPCLQTRSQ